MFKRKSKSDKPAKAKKAKGSKPPKVPKKARKKAAPRTPLEKAPTDIYTVMIVISALAVAVGCILLLLELQRYGSYPWWNA